MKHNLFSRFISVLLAVVMLAGLMSMPSLADAVTGTDTATADAQTTDSVDTTTDEAGSAPATLSEDGEEDKTAAGEESGEPVTEEDNVSGEENTSSDVNTPSGEENAPVDNNEEETSSESDTVGSEDESTSADVDASQEETTPAEEETESDMDDLYAEAKDQDGNVVATVKAKAEKGVLDEGTELVAELLTGSEEDAAAEELADADVQYDGFMALDIHLVNKQGEEVEPDGKVNVVMVVPAALPENADPTTVAVQHHEEQADGTVKVEEVASAADTAALAATPATLDLTEDSSEETPAPTLITDDSQVTADFTVDSFSKFTITWTDSNGGKQKATVYYVTDNGSQIKVEGLPTEVEVPVTTNGVVNLEDKAYARTISGYSYEGALLNYGPAEVDFEEHPEMRIQATAIEYTEGGGWKYYGQNGGYNVWDLPEGLNEYRVFLVYRVNSSYNDIGTTVDTVDTEGKIKINLFDYDAGYSNNINSGHYLKFLTGTYSDNNKKDGWGWLAPIFPHPNIWTATLSGLKDSVLQGIVQNRLVNGYPKLNAAADWDWYDYGENYKWPTTGQEEELLAYLFDPATARENIGHGVTTVVEDANKLFQQNADGYYYYDSHVNRAWLNKENSEFEVYSKQGQNQLFNPFASERTSNSLNEFFGMTIETKFIMPEEGKVNGQPMVFEFSGDDDVWVFIDDVLVLDMGGNHGEIKGSIDFSTGKVIVDKINSGYVGEFYNVPGETPNKVDYIADLFTAAQDSWDGSPYKTHTLKFFYLERGGNQSNCEIRFNLPIVPDGSLSIAKELEKTGSKDLQQYLMDTVNYKFRVLKANKRSDGTYEKTDDLFITATDSEGNPVKYEIWEGGRFTGDYGYVADDGTITLKAGQMAVFPGVISGNSSDFYVQELIPENANGQYDKVEYTVSNDGGEADSINSQDVVVSTTDFEGYDSTVLDPPEGEEYKNESYGVQFTNTVNTDKMALLNITKDIPGETVDTTTTFKMQVTINGQLIPKGTHYTLDGADQTVTEEGIIPLQEGQTATILMQAGEDTTYKVVELTDGLEQDQYVFGSYTRNTSHPKIDPETGEPVIDPDTQEQAIVTETQTLTPSETAPDVRSEGITNEVIYAGQVDDITVTNNTKNGFLTITKAIKDGSNPFNDGRDVFAFKIQKCDNDGTPIDGTVWYMYANGAEAATLDGEKDKLELESGTYLITELNNVNYTLDSVTVNDEEVTPIDESVKVDVGNSLTTEVIYTNECSNLNYTDGSGVINKFSEDTDNGEKKITFEPFWIAGDAAETENLQPTPIEPQN